VRHCASVSQAASPISTAMSRIKLVVVWFVAGTGKRLGFAGAASTGPDIVARGGLLGAGCGAVAGSAPTATTQADNAAALNKTAHSALSLLSLAKGVERDEFFMP
jgi:hypothetical protein